MKMYKKTIAVFIVLCFLFLAGYCVFANYFFYSILVKSFFGNSFSQYFLSQYYLERNEREKAHYWLNIASENGNLNAVLEYSWVLIEQKNIKGFEMLRGLALKGNAEICNELSLNYSFTSDSLRHFIKKRDSAESLKWLDLALEHSIKQNKYNDTLFYLVRFGEIYFYGGSYYHYPEIKLNHKKALEYFEKAEKLIASYRDNIQNMLPVYYYLGMIYLYGKSDVSKDLQKSSQYFLKESNKTIVANELVKVFFNGTGVEKNLKKALSVEKSSILPDDNENNEDSIFNFPSLKNYEMYKCYYAKSFYNNQTEILIRKENDNIVLKTKIYSSKKIDSRKEKISNFKWEGFQKIVVESNFFELFSNVNYLGSDGHYYIAVGIQKGRLQIINRWVDSKDVDPVCSYLFNLAGLKLNKNE